MSKKNLLLAVQLPLKMPKGDARAAFCSYQYWYRYTVQNHPREEWHYINFDPQNTLTGSTVLCIVVRNGNVWLYAKRRFKHLNNAMIAAERDHGRKDE